MSTLKADTLQAKTTDGTLTLSNNGSGKVALPSDATIGGTAMTGSFTPYVAPGTSGNVLTSNGSAWTSGAAPASRVLISTSTLSSATLVTLTDCFTTTYSQYEFLFLDWESSKAGDAEIQFEVEVGDAYKTSAYAWTLAAGYAGANTRSGGSTSDATGVIGLNRNAGPAEHRSLVSLPTDTGRQKTIFTQGYWDDSSMYTYNSFATWEGGTGAWQSIRFKPDSGNFSGTLKLYGIK